MPVVGVISDTHGLLRPEVLKIFGSVDLIIHAGDIGTPEVLEELQTLAPAVAVRGNNDHGPWARRFPEFTKIAIGRISVFLIHDIKEMDLRDSAECNVIISGHSHKPSVERRSGVLYLNPGSAGPRRFKLPVCVARLTIRQSSASARLIDVRT
jgi:putative phosphoesterase